jgi:lipopolysaccharide transport system permease protein
MALLMLIMLYFGVWPSWRLLTLPLFLAVAFSSSLGIGLWLSALNVRYRDFQFVVPFILQFGLYLSPVGFSSSVVPPQWSLVYAFNPMVGVIDGFRWAILGGDLLLRWDIQAISVMIGFTLLITGIAFFRRSERGMADVI